MSEVSEGIGGEGGTRPQASATVRVKLSTSFPGWPLLRQTPGGTGRWGKYEFRVDDDTFDCDFWVVFDGPHVTTTARCPRENTVFISAEPPTLATYRAEFLSQFATVISCHKGLRHPNVIVTQQALPWHIGSGGQTHTDTARFLGYDDFRRAALEKPRLLSVISSAKALTRGHRLRLDFVKKLQLRFKDRVDVFGRGIRDVDDKWDAIAPYKYHIAIENSSFADYWTEKLSDAYLGGAFPFYHGCPNIGRYFAADALEPIDISRPAAAIDAIERVVEDDRFGRSADALRTACDLVLDKYNLFPMLADLLSRRPAGGEPVEMTIRPRGTFETGVRTALRRVAQRMPRSVKRLFK